MKDKKAFMEAMAMMSLLTQIGLSMAIPIMICTYIGRNIDIKLNTEPVFLLIFLFFGILGAFSGVHQILIQLTKKRK